MLNITAFISYESQRTIINNKVNNKGRKFFVIIKMIILITNLCYFTKKLCIKIVAIQLFNCIPRGCLIYERCQLFPSLPVLHQVL